MTNAILTSNAIESYAVCVCFPICSYQSPRLIALLEDRSSTAALRAIVLFSLGTFAKIDALRARMVALGVSEVVAHIHELDAEGRKNATRLVEKLGGK